jgi:hypothetical protein
VGYSSRLSRLRTAWWRKRNGQLWHHLLVSTFEPRQVMELLGRPSKHIYEPELVAPAYAQLYDQRAGAIEIEIKEDEQGVGLTKRRKKRAAARADDRAAE